MSDDQVKTPGNDYVPTILLLDDDELIIKALNRVLRSSDYRLLSATDSETAFSMLRENPIHVVVSDYHMPDKDGITFLTEVSKQWPNTVRIMLTGCEDQSVAIKAINCGAISRYLSKPWDDDVLKAEVRGALILHQLGHEKRHLEEVTYRQNEELKKLNLTLEERVKARTMEVEQTSDMLDLAYKEMKRSFVNAIPVFANLVELREGSGGGHSRRVAEHCKLISQKLKLKKEEQEDIYFAALLHDIGVIGLPDELSVKPYASLNRDERLRYEQHPVRAQSVLIAMDALNNAGVIIRGHHERFDGKGYPDKLFGDRIPMGSRILSVANDYDSLIIGMLLDTPLSRAEAREYLEENKGTRYDPEIVDIYQKILDEIPDSGPIGGELRLFTKDLRAGMILSKDLVNGDGVLLLTKDHVLSENVINKITALEAEEKNSFMISVYHDAEHDQQGAA